MIYLIEVFRLAMMSSYQTGCCPILLNWYAAGTRILPDITFLLQNHLYDPVDAKVLDTNSLVAHFNLKTGLETGEELICFLNMKDGQVISKAKVAVLYGECSSS